MAQPLKVQNGSNSGDLDMKALRFIQKWLHRLLSFDASLWFDKLTILSRVEGSAGIDSHRWESKIEILGSLSR